MTSEKDLAERVRELEEIQADILDELAGLTGLLRGVGGLLRTLPSPGDDVVA